MSSDQPPVKLVFDKDSNSLKAHVGPLDKPAAFNLVMLENLIASENYSDLEIYQPALKHVIDAVFNANLLTIEIGCKRDASIDIEISSDKMLASAKTTRAYGGELLAHETIIATLKANGIDPRCWNNDVITDLLNNPEGTDVDDIAKGNHLQIGEDGYFKLLYDPGRSGKPSIGANDVADFHDLSDYIVVEANTPLMERVPPTQGDNGYNLLGEELAGSLGNDVSFSSNCEGVIPHPDNENILLANIKGHPTAIPDGVIVQNSLSFKDVDISTGNIDFDGSIEIKGTVSSGMRVQATGDIFIAGVVESAAIISQGDVVVKGGAIGLSNDDNTFDDNESRRCRISARNVSVKFANFALIKCTESVSAKEYIINSEVDCSGHLYIGQDSGKGVLVGGHSYAQRGVFANIIGSEAYVETIVASGSKEDLYAAIKKSSKHIENRRQELAQINTIFDKIKKLGSPSKVGKTVLNKAHKLNAAISLLSDEIVALGKRLAIQKKEFNTVEKSCVSAKVQLFPNAKIEINGSSYLCQHELKAVKFEKKLNQIQMSAVEN